MDSPGVCDGACFRPARSASASARRSRSASRRLRGQPFSMTAIGPDVGLEIGRAQGLRQLRDSVPHGLRLFEVGTRSSGALGAAPHAFRPAAEPGLAPEAGMEHLFVRRETTAARDVRDGLPHAVDLLPGGDGPFLMGQAPGLAEVRRAPRAHDTARGHHLGHIGMIIRDPQRRKRPLPASAVHPPTWPRSSPGRPRPEEAEKDGRSPPAIPP